MQPSHNRFHAPRRAPVRLVLAVILLAMLIMAALIAWLAYQFALLSPPIATVLRVAMFAVPLVGAVELGAIAWRRWGRLDTVKADKVIELTRAQRQMFPASLQSLSFHDSSRPQLAAPVEEEIHAPPGLLPPAVPSFGDLLSSGRIGPNTPLILGFDAATAQPIEGGWDALYSCGIGALQGAGKSWLAAFLLAQSAAQGGRLIVCDLHAGNPESLATRIEALAPAFMCDVASTPDAILCALKLASDKLEQRKAGKGGVWNIIIAIDEWTSLLRGKLGDVLPAYVEDFTEQGRKFGINCLLSAQGWTKDTAGVVRNRLTSHYVLRQRPDEARYQLGLPASACPLDVRFLPDATGYLLDVRGNLTKVCIPQMTSADLARVATLIDRPAAAVGQPFGFQRVTAHVTPSAQLVTPRRQDGDTLATSAVPVTTASGSIKAVSPEAARVLDLLHAGNDLPAIVKELRGVAPREGRRYMTALTEVTELLRQATKGG